jgi:hypothetical protein
VATNFDRTKTLQQLERQDWGEPTFDSHLVTTCHRLRRKPLDEFTVEDLRIMIGQKISLFFLVPIALERLEVDPLAEGNYYAGDLLAAILAVNNEFWTARPDLLQGTRLIVRRAKELLSSQDDNDHQAIRRTLTEASREFLE